MDSHEAIVDVHKLADDLRTAVAYASRAGLLRDRAMIDTLCAADKTLTDDKVPNVHVLTTAVNDIVQLIAPVTLVDLKYGRYPFSEKNQRRAQTLQLLLTTLALVTLVLVGSLMESLRSEQEVLQLLQQVQDARPQQKLTSLRRLVQFEKPLDKANVAAEAYYLRLNELVQLNSKMKGSYMRALVAAETPFIAVPWFPWNWLLERFESRSSALTNERSVNPSAASASAAGQAMTAVVAKSSVPMLTAGALPPSVASTSADSGPFF